MARICRKDCTFGFAWRKISTCVMHTWTVKPITTICIMPKFASCVICICITWWICLAMCHSQLMLICLPRLLWLAVVKPLSFWLTTWRNLSYRLPSLAPTTMGVLTKPPHGFFCRAFMLMLRFMPARPNTTRLSCGQAKSLTAIIRYLPKEQVNTAHSKCCLWVITTLMAPNKR